MSYSPINIAIGCLWLLSAASDYADFAYIWQLKEYRRDRFRDFLTTEQGRRYFRRWSTYYRLGGLVFALFWPFNNIVAFKEFFLSLLVIDAVILGIHFWKHQMKRPKPTPKALLLMGLSFFLEAGIFLMIRDWTFVFFLLLARFFIITFLVACLEVPTRMGKSFIIRMATKKMTKFPSMKIIGITGSYGKSSVKEFTAHILSQKFNVVKTPKNINSEIGVAKFILKTDFTGKEFFIVEMGAYKTGEIKLICEMVHPTVGVLTAVGEQHLSLFGSIKNIQQAKYELLRSIPQDGFIVTNADNKYCTELLSELDCKNVETFGTDEDNHPTCLTTDIQTTLKGTEFEGTYKGNSGRIETPVIGAHHAYNISAAVLVAIHFGLSREQIIGACKTLPTSIQGSIKIYNYGQAMIIDDSYNSNPQGFKSALDVMTYFPSDKKRIVITRGMLELGERSDELHETLGGEIAFIADELVIITPDFFEPLKRGVGEKYRTKILLKEDPEELFQYIQKLKNENCIILVENRLPIHLYNEISQERPV